MGEDCAVTGKHAEDKLHPPPTPLQQLGWQNWVSESPAQGSESPRVSPLVGESRTQGFLWLVSAHRLVRLVLG